MARVLIVGCGCRGRALARELRAEGHAVRGTTRDAGRAAELEADGLEPWVGDPDRVGSLVYALDGVTVLCWLLGDPVGPEEQAAALHGPRLQMMLAKVVDTTVRGVLYEPAPRFPGGCEVVARAHATWEIPVAYLDADPAAPERWTAAAKTTVEGLLGPR